MLFGPTAQQERRSALPQVGSVLVPDLLRCHCTEKLRCRHAQRANFRSARNPSWPRELDTRDTVGLSRVPGALGSGHRESSPDARAARFDSRPRAPRLALPTCGDFASRPGGWNGKGLSPRRPLGRFARGEENSSREELPCPRWPLTARGRAESPLRPQLEGQPGVWGLREGGRRWDGNRESLSPCVPERGRLCISSFSPRS